MTTPQKGQRIFISYRRADSAGYAGRIYDRLTAHFGEDAVFMDVDTIRAGLDFVKVLQNAVQSCDVLVALIGRSWLDIKDDAGKRRLDHPEDFVRIEVATALERDIRVIPVLVDGAAMPNSTELPENLKPLARRNAVQVNHHSFNGDTQRLISQLKLGLKAAEDSKILKAQALEKEQARAQRQIEIDRLLKAADVAISLKDWNLAHDKLSDVLILDTNYLEAQAKLDIVKQKMTEFEAERAEKVRSAKERRERIARLLKVFDLSVNKSNIKTGKSARLSYVFAGGAILVCAILYGIGYFIQKSLTPTNQYDESSRATQNAQISDALTATSVAFSLSQTPQATMTSVVNSTPVAIDIPEEPKQLGVGSTRISEMDGMVMVYIPAGDFQMGNENGDDDEKPVHTIYLDAYWIDQMEVTNTMYSKCVDIGTCNSTSPKFTNSPTRNRYYGYPEFNNYPVIYISWDDANSYCEWTGRRLPTEAEWEKAAGWDDYSQEKRVFPWGPFVDASFANYNEYLGDTTAVGSYRKNISFYGTYDMAGNVAEWVDDWYDVYPGGNERNSEFFGKTYRVVRGGSWIDKEIDLRSASRSWFDPSKSNEYIGFRCARDAENP